MRTRNTCADAVTCSDVAVSSQTLGRVMYRSRSGFLLAVGLLFAGVVSGGKTTAQTASSRAEDAQRPNIVLMFPDNLGWGEVGAYGGVRGVPTPQIDRIADEGIRLNNFNVENSCTVSRIALFTGRYAARAGGTQATGMTLWEVTIAEALKEQGYATGLFGKWHVGGDNWEGRREPQHQGFDEWYGIPGTSHDGAIHNLRDVGSGNDGRTLYLGRQGGGALAQGKAVRHGDAADGRP